MAGKLKMLSAERAERAKIWLNTSGSGIKGAVSR